MVAGERASLEARGRKRCAEFQRAVRLLKEARQAAGLSLADVAARSGIDRSRLSKLENDPHGNPTVTTLARIADAVGVRLAIRVVHR